MRILVFAPAYVPEVGGVEIMLSQVLPRLAERGHTVSVVAARNRSHLPGDEVLDGIRVRRVDMVAPLHASDPAWVLRIRSQVGAIRRELEPDLVHNQDIGVVSWFEHSTRHQRPAPTIVTVQTEVPGVGRDPESTVRQLLRGADWVTGVSEATLGWAHAFEPGIAPRSSVIPNAVPTRRSSTPESSAASPRLVALGRLVEQKGFDVALDAMAIVRERHPGAVLSIGGAGPAAADLAGQVDRLGLRRNVQLVGAVDHGAVPDFLAGASVVVMPSRFEGLPLVALEAAAQARPIVASAVSGIPEVVVDGRTGVLVPPEDPRALAAALDRLLSRPDEARRLGDAARARVLDRYSLDAVVDAYEALYERVLTARDGNDATLAGGRGHR